MEQTQAEHDAAVQHAKESNDLRDAMLKALSSTDQNDWIDLKDYLHQAGLNDVVAYFDDQLSISNAAKTQVEKLNEALRQALLDQQTAANAAFSAVDIMAFALERNINTSVLSEVKRVLKLDVGEPAKKPFDKHAKRYGLRTKFGSPRSVYSTKTFKEGGMTPNLDEADRLDLETADAEKQRMTEKAGWSLEIFEFDDHR